MTDSDGSRGNLRLAVLIDADNAPRDCIKGLMEELALYGVPTIKRIYGDWTNPNLKGWKASTLENAFTPVQQYGYTTGKNATDSAMIIDAMDILYAGRTDGFVVVSSDSDFTRLATRLREAGMYVIGVGERKTPGPFIVSCSKFIYIEVIRERVGTVDRQITDTPDPKKTAAERKAALEQKRQAAASKKHPEQTPPPASQQEAKPRVPGDIVELIAGSVADLADDDGFAPLSDLTNLINKKRPDFDARNFGFSKLSNMMKYLSRFEVDVRETGDPHAKPMYIRDVEA